MEISALKKQLAAVRAANPGVGPAEERAAGRLARELDRLKGALAKAELKLAADPGEVGKLERQLKAARTQIANLRVSVHYITTMHGAAFTPELEKNIRVCLHPDWVTDPKQKRRYEKTLADFNAVMDALKAKQKGRAR